MAEPAVPPEVVRAHSHVAFPGHSAVAAQIVAATIAGKTPPCVRSASQRPRVSRRGAVELLESSRVTSGHPPGSCISGWQPYIRCQRPRVATQHVHVPATTSCDTWQRPAVIDAGAKPMPDVKHATAHARSCSKHRSVLTLVGGRPQNRALPNIAEVHATAWRRWTAAYHEQQIKAHVNRTTCRASSPWQTCT